jgi:ketosteroid isomerase-like protein
MKADAVTEKEVTDVLNKFIETYSKRNLEGLMSLVAPDPDACLIDIEPDEKRVGLDAIKSQLARDWSQYEASTYEINWISISAAGAVAWIASEVLFKVKTKGHSLVFPCCATAVFEKRGGKWLIMQGHFSIPDVKQYSSLI